MKSLSPATSGPPRPLARIGHGAAGALVLLLALTVLLPPLMGFELHLVGGASMSPSVPRGSVVLERRAPVSELKKNDVITLTRPGADRPVTRRIVSTDRDRLGRRIFWTKADAAARPDPKPVHFESAQQPRVSSHVPYVGWVLIAFGDPGIGLLLGGSLGLAIAALILAWLWRERDPALTAASHRV